VCLFYDRRRSASLAVKFRRARTGADIERAAAPQANWGTPCIPRYRRLWSGFSRSKYSLCSSAEAASEKGTSRSNQVRSLRSQGRSKQVATQEVRKPLGLLSIIQRPWEQQRWFLCRLNGGPAAQHYPFGYTIKRSWL
jgi:hypothetical protein